MQIPVGGEAGQGVNGDRMNRTASGLPVCGQRGSAAGEMVP